MIASCKMLIYAMHLCTFTISFSFLFCRWPLIPQTKRMLNPQGPKTEKGSAAVPENGIANPHHLARGIALVIGFVLNLSKGQIKLCFHYYGFILYLYTDFFWVNFSGSDG